MSSRSVISSGTRIAAGLFSIVLLSSGCEGDPGGGVTDGSIERPTSTGGSGGIGAQGGGGGGGRGGAAGDARVLPDTPPPTPSPQAVKILPGQTDLLGSFQTGCTFGPGADRWCAVSRPLSLSTRELWLVNVSKAAANRTLLNACDTPGICVKASQNIYTAQPDVGPVYPEDSARASGNTFMYLTDAKSAPSDAFEGDVWVHTVGSPNQTQIGSSVFDCAVAGQRLINQGQRQIDKVVGICAGNPSSAAGDPVNFFTLKGGVVPGQMPAASPPALPLQKMMTPLGDIQRIHPVQPATNALRWRVGFTADGETLVLSGGGATEAEVEKLVTYKIDDTLGKGGTPTPMPNGDNVTRWTLSADGTKIFFFREYNYNAMGNQSGTLTVADFPSGANVRELRGMRVPGGSTGGVGAYRVLVDDKGVDQGVGVLTNLTMGRGNYSIIKNIAGSMDDAANVVSVVQATRSLPLPSPDLRFSLFAREFSMEEPTSDIWVTKNDGTSSCALTQGTAGGIFGFPFTQLAGLILWTDLYEAATLSADGLYTDPNDCANPAKKKKFANHVDFWFVDGDRMLLYSDESNGAQVSLKYAWVNGNTLGAPVTIQERADRFFHIILDAQTPGTTPRFKGIVYTLSGGGDQVNGAYYYELPASPGAGPTPDASAGN
jgi:hypothetical protein